MTQSGEKYCTISSLYFIYLWNYKLIKRFSNEIHSRLHTGKNMSDAFHIQNVLRQGDAFSPLIFLDYTIRKDWNWV